MIPQEQLLEFDGWITANGTFGKPRSTKSSGCSGIRIQGTTQSFVCSDTAISRHPSSFGGLACSCKGRERPQEKIMLVDVKKALLYGSITRHVYIRLREEDEESEVERTVKEAGFLQSPTTPCVYFNEATNVRVVVHVDDFLCTGPEPGLANLRRCLQNKYVIKFEILGAGANEKKAGKFLGRVIKWTENGLTYKGDDKLLESLL